MRGTPVVKQTPGLRELDPVALRRVSDGTGHVLFEFKEPGRKQVVKSGYAYQITDILKDHDAKRHSYDFPQAQFNVKDRRPLTAKTGTQQGPKSIQDVLATWNFGYTPDLAVGVWVGNANNALVNPNVTAYNTSLMIWKDFIEAAVEHLKLQPKDFPVPPDIEFQTVNGKKEPIVKGTKIVDKEDLKLWESAGNQPFPTYGGLSGSPVPGAGAQRQQGQGQPQGQGQQGQGQSQGQGQPQVQPAQPAQAAPQAVPQPAPARQPSSASGGQFPPQPQAAPPSQPADTQTQPVQPAAPAVQPRPRPAPAQPPPQQAPAPQPQPVPVPVQPQAPPPQPPPPPAAPAEQPPAQAAPAQQAAPCQPQPPLYLPCAPGR